MRLGRLLVAGYPLAVGRVDAQQAGRRILGRVRGSGRGDVLVQEHQVASEASAARVGLRRCDRGTVAVRTAHDDWQRLQLPRARLLDQPLPQRGIMAEPVREPPVLAQQPRRGLGRDPRGLDHERAGAAHRVEELPARCRDGGPACAQQDAGREVLAQRCFPGRKPVTAARERIAREVQQQRNLAAVCMGVHTQVRLLGLDLRPLAGGVAQLVADRVLELQRAEMRVVERLVRAGELAGQRAARIEVIAPVDATRQCVERIGIHNGTTRHFQQHAACHAGFQAGAVAGFERPAEADTGAGLADIGATQCGDLDGQQVGEAAGHRRGEAQQRRGRAVGQLRSIHVVFSSVNLSKACSDLSRPMPDCRKPPNGTVMSSAS